MYLTDSPVHHAGIGLEGTKQPKEHCQNHVKLKSRLQGSEPPHLSHLPIALEDVGWSRSSPTVLYLCGFDVGIVNTIKVTTRLANSQFLNCENSLPCSFFHVLLLSNVTMTWVEELLIRGHRTMYFSPISKDETVYLQSDSNASFSSLAFPDPYFPGLLAQRAHSCRRER